MQNQENHHRRQSIRLKEYNYAQPGAYFVTIVSHLRKNIFGEIINGEMKLNQAGKIVDQTWRNIPGHFPNATCEIFIVMPNHIHGIIEIKNDQIVGARHASPLQSMGVNGVKPGSVGAIIGSFKSAVTKQLHQNKIITQEKIWQRNYYEHIIRDEDDYQKIADYISTNPFNWDKDHENPANFNFSRWS